MKKTLGNLILTALLALGFAASSAIPALQAQATLSSTTLGAAVTSEGTTTVVVASATGITANRTMLQVDRERLAVNAVSGTTLTVQRGADGTKAATHASGATVYLGGPTQFGETYQSGSCTAANLAVLPVLWAQGGFIYQCNAGTWSQSNQTPVYLATIVGLAAPSAASPAAGGQGLVATGGAGGAQSATTGNGATGGAPAITGGVGGAGGSSSGTGGTGGAITFTGGAGGGTITGGTGGAVSLLGGAGGNGSSAGGSGGLVLLKAGAAGTGGTGAAAKITFADATDGTKRVNFDVSGITTATTRTVTLPDANITLNGVAVTNCLTGGATCSGSTVSSTAKIVYGLSGALNGASPSVAAVTLGVTFTSSATYSCTAQLLGNSAAVAAGGLAIAYTSSSVITFTGANGASGTISYICIGT
jgi:hypothetical protein